MTDLNSLFGSIDIYLFDQLLRGRISSGFLRPGSPLAGRAACAWGNGQPHGFCFVMSGGMGRLGSFGALCSALRRTSTPFSRPGSLPFIVPSLFSRKNYGCASPRAIRSFRLHVLSCWRRTR
jgi:hypothetical protein